MSISNKQTTDLFPSRDQTYSIRIAAIQKQLNSCCCFHDSLMPLLQLNAIQSSSYRWQNSLKSINKKIADYEDHLNILTIENSREPNVTFKQQDYQRISPINKIKKNIEELRQNLQQFSKKALKNIGAKQTQQSKLNFSTQSLTNNSHSKSLITQVQDSKQPIKELKRYVQMSLALFKNQLIINSLSQSNKLQNSRTLSDYSNNQQQIIQKLQKSMFNELKKQLQAIKNGVNIYDIEDFHQFTINRILNNLMEINQITQSLFPESPSQILNSKQKEKINFQLTDVIQKLKLIDWQIRGLKKKYLSQLNIKYRNYPEPYQVHSLQKKLVKDLVDLEKQYHQIQAKTNYIKEKILQY